MSRRPHLMSAIACSLLATLILFAHSAHGFSNSVSRIAVAGAHHKYTQQQLPVADSTIIYNIPHSSSVLHAKKQNNVNKEINTNGDDEDTNILGIFKKSPGTIIIAPFVFLFGFDLIANILVVTKRSLEVAFTGEYTVWTPWVH